METVEMNIVYRVSIKIGYYQADFEFENVEEAATFARAILEKQTDTEDAKKSAYVRMYVVDKVREAKEDEE